MEHVHEGQLRELNNFFYYFKNIYFFGVNRISSTRMQRLISRALWDSNVNST
jgi:hypothetical protein